MSACTGRGRPATLSCFGTAYPTRVGGRYGQGEATDNAKPFMEWLCNKERGPGAMANLRFGVRVHTLLHPRDCSLPAYARRHACTGVHVEADHDRACPCTRNTRSTRTLKGSHAASWRPLRYIALTEVLVSSLRTQLFGLGNRTTYPERFQAASRAFDRRVRELGALPIVERGEGDDNGG